MCDVGTIYKGVDILLYNHFLYKPMACKLSQSQGFKGIPGVAKLAILVTVITYLKIWHDGLLRKNVLKFA